jgi:hypothetical protein
MRVCVLGKHDKDIITVKEYYSDNVSTVEYGI